MFFPCTKLPLFCFGNEEVNNMWFEEIIKQILPETSKLRAHGLCGVEVALRVNLDVVIN